MPRGRNSQRLRRCIYEEEHAQTDVVAWSTNQDLKKLLEEMEPRANANWYVPSRGKEAVNTDPSKEFVNVRVAAASPYEEASKLSKLLGSSSKGVSVIQRAGHQVMEERPVQVFAVLKEAVAAVAIKAQDSGRYM